MAFTTVEPSRLVDLEPTYSLGAFSTAILELLGTIVKACRTTTSVAASSEAGHIRSLA
jgi:hypothetical protein